MKKQILGIVLLLIFQHSFSQKTVSIDSINKFIFTNDLDNVFKNSTFKSKNILKEKLDSIQKIILMYHIDTEKLHSHDNKSRVYGKNSRNNLNNKNIIKTYRLSPKYTDFFEAGHTIKLSYETYEDDKCGLLSSNCKKFNHKLTEIKILYNYMDATFDLNNYLEFFFQSGKEHSATFYIKNKEKTLKCTFNKIDTTSINIFKYFDEIKYLEEKEYNLDQKSNIYIIYFNKSINNSKFSFSKKNEYFVIFFNSSSKKMIINIGEKFYLVNNPKNSMLKKMIIKKFKTK